MRRTVLEFETQHVGVVLGEENTVTTTFRPADGSAPGEHEVRLTAAGTSRHARALGRAVRIHELDGLETHHDVVATGAGGAILLIDDESEDGDVSGVRR